MIMGERWQRLVCDGSLVWRSFFMIMSRLTARQASTAQADAR